MICKAGHVTKRAVGSIKILDTESQFEIAGDKAETFWAAVKENGTGEKGVTIQRIDGKAPARTEPSNEAPPPSWNSAKKGKFKPKSKPRPESSPGAPPPKKAKKQRPKA
jgi:ATP-dependent RNA helicase DeaD